MTDYFALLRQPRKPWLDPGELKEEYHRRTKTDHPDRHPAASPDSDFASVNEAYRVLADPKRRVQHLLALEDAPAVTDKIPDELADAFLETGTLVQEIDRLLARSTTNALGNALLRPEIIEKQKLTTDLLEKLGSMSLRAIDQLQALDLEWEAGRKDLPALAMLSSRLAYLGRWKGQLEERTFQLSLRQ